jgi:hypothetical protein
VRNTAFAIEEIEEVRDQRASLRERRANRFAIFDANRFAIFDIERACPEALEELDRYTAKCGMALGVEHLDRGDR